MRRRDYAGVELLKHYRVAVDGVVMGCSCVVGLVPSCPNGHCRGLAWRCRVGP